MELDGASGATGGPAGEGAKGGSGCGASESDLDAGMGLESARELEARLGWNATLKGNKPIPAIMTVGPEAEGGLAGSRQQICPRTSEDNGWL